MRNSKQDRLISELKTNIEQQQTEIDFLKKENAELKMQLEGNNKDLPSGLIPIANPSRTLDTFNDDASFAIWAERADMGDIVSARALIADLVTCFEHNSPIPGGLRDYFLPRLRKLTGESDKDPATILNLKCLEGAQHQDGYRCLCIVKDMLWLMSYWPGNKGKRLSVYKASKMLEEEGKQGEEFRFRTEDYRLPANKIDEYFRRDVSFYAPTYFPEEYADYLTRPKKEPFGKKTKQ